MTGRILSADLLRLGKQRSTWILPLATFVIVFIFGCLNGMIYGNAPWLNELHGMMKEGMSTLDGSSDSMAIIFDAEFPSLADYVVMTFQRESVIAIVIFASVYVSAVKRNGYSKNIAGIYNSFSYNVSQAIVLLGYSIMITLINLCANVASASIFFTGIDPGNFGSLLLYFVVSALLHWAACLMIVIVSDAFKSPTVAIVVGCLYTGAVASLLYTGLNALIDLLVKTDFRVNHLFPFAFSIIMKYDVPESYVYGAAIAVIYAALFFVLKLLIRKKDIA